MTIHTLGLDYSRLNTHRKKVIKASGLFDDALTDDDLKQLADAIMQRNDEGHFVEFCFAISSVLKELADI
ncbi:MAG: hypothetical protein QG599_3176 [Pseudomonadota bacterium]|nr:hypothetical protein [Pseudomonadota bacterium]